MGLVDVRIGRLGDSLSLISIMMSKRVSMAFSLLTCGSHSYYKKRMYVAA